MKSGNTQDKDATSWIWQEHIKIPQDEKFDETLNNKKKKLEN